MATTRGVVLGCFQGDKDDEIIYTDYSKSFLSGSQQTTLSKLLEKSKFKPEYKSSRSFFGEFDGFDCAVVVGLGKLANCICDEEELDTKKECIRESIAVAAHICNDLKLDEVKVDDCGDAKSVGEAISLSQFNYDTLKSKKKEHFVKFELCTDDSSKIRLFNDGTIYGQSQNFARVMSETPANHMNPTLAGKMVEHELSSLPNVSVTIHDKKWIEDKKMGLFLSVAQGSDQPPVLAEIHYKGTDDSVPPIALVGKGITFDSGGISLKPSAKMHAMKADMQGGACVAAAIRGASLLGLKVNIVGIIPFSENLINGHATKPGDVHFGMNGKSVEITNTDAEGRLVLADALHYVETTFKPSTIIDLATLTGAILIALGSGITSGVFTRSRKLFEELHSAGMDTGDRMWRMPLFNCHKPLISSPVADMNNIASVNYGGSSTAAVFLKEFVDHKEWAHIDIAGVMENSGTDPAYIPKGMTGRPTRTIIEFLSRRSV